MPIKLEKTEDAKIDEIHEDELKLINTLIESLKDGSDEEIERLFLDLIDHSFRHFEYEESLMDTSSGYSFKELHKTEHYKVISDLRYQLQNWRNFKDRWELNEYLESDLLTWLDQHIKAMDIPMVEFFRSFDR